MKLGRNLAVIGLTVSLSMLISTTSADDQIIFHDAFMEREREPVTATSGQAFKGPFRIGSDVTIALLDEKLEQTGQQFTGEVTSHDGAYIVSANIPDTAVELTVNGFFFNEVSDSISPAPLRLRALTRASSNININVISALETERVRALVQEGKSFSEAKKQALNEVMGVFGFQPTAIDSTEISLDGEDGAALLAITAMILTNGDGSSRSIDELLGLITALRGEFVTGDLGTETRTLLVRSGSAVDTAAFVANLAEYLISVDQTSTMPTINQALDTALAASANKVVVTAGRGGSVSESGVNWLMDGESISINITPNSRYLFEAIDTNCEGSLSDDNTIFELSPATTDCELSAIFTVNPNTWPEGYVHCGEPTQVIEVHNPVTGRSWMDRNLGASRAAQSMDDDDAYGSLFQWGRFADGHQCRDSETFMGPVASAEPNTGAPWDSKFVLTEQGSAEDNWNWIDTLNPNLWQEPNRINNPCPIGFTVPTFSEWNAEVRTWGDLELTGETFGFAQVRDLSTAPLKIAKSGTRSPYDGSISGQGGTATHATSSSSPGDPQIYRAVTFSPAFGWPSNTGAPFAQGLHRTGVSIRCIAIDD